MAIVYSIATYASNDWQLYQSLAQAINAAALTVRVPLTGSISPAVTRGLWRTKVYNAGGTSPTFSSVTVTATDGTNTVTVGNFNAVSAITISSTAYVDLNGTILFDVAASSTGGQSGTLIFGGATSFTFTYTCGGTSYTFSADCEIAAVP